MSKTMTHNEIQAHREIFHRLASAMRTRHPRIPRDVAARLAALELVDPGLPTKILQATRAASGRLEQ
jgi:hypothetical protein